MVPFTVTLCEARNKLDKPLKIIFARLERLLDSKVITQSWNYMVIQRTFYDFTVLMMLSLSFIANTKTKLNARFKMKSVQ